MLKEENYVAVLRIPVLFCGYCNPSPTDPGRRCLFGFILLFVFCAPPTFVTVWPVCVQTWLKEVRLLDMKSVT